jgi:hypothetical protein
MDAGLWANTPQQEHKKADSADAVAKAVGTFAAKVEKIAPRMKEASAKCPELNN